MDKKIIDFMIDRLGGIEKVKREYENRPKSIITTLTFDPELSTKIDAARGNKSIGRFLTDLVKAEIERESVNFKGGKYYTAPVEKDPLGTRDFVAEFQTPKSYSPPKYGPVTAYSKFDDGAWYSIQCSAANGTKLSKPCAGCGKEIFGVSHITGIDLFCEDCWSKGTSE